MDNASANDDDLLNLKNQLSSLDSLLRTFITSATSPSLEKHFKCCARVLDLMVHESLKVASDVLDKIRNSLKYLSVSNSRLKQFYQCVEEVGGGDGSYGLHLDVS
ncbi:zinc finger BED domain-containing protein RICESLEEPER, partial [Trifolium medium]|nr:zinc finger BED domain-containing protein RICESLEEPER [Trifolium medium]